MKSKSKDRKNSSAFIVPKSIKPTKTNTQKSNGTKRDKKPSEVDFFPDERSQDYSVLEN